MKRTSVFLISIFISLMAIGQQTGYYNGTEGKSGEELKAALNQIISGHTPYSYYFSKEIFKLSDADPDNPDNVIQVYTGFSHDNSDYGSSGLTLNREHVWAKSHGDFGDWPPMYGDVHNLKPSAAAVNQDKSNLDFDNGGVQHDIATGCYYTDSTWEARDEVKGDIARIIFYMATRYEGHNGELDLEVVDHNNTYPYAQHGKLSTLLQWNQMDPPDEFERHRNDVIFSFQKNRNPFIDNPEFVDLIWGGAAPGPISVGNVQMNPELAAAGEPVTITATITSTGDPVSEGILFWGYAYDSLNNSVSMTADGDVYTAEIPGQAEGVTVYYKVTGIYNYTTGSSVVYNYYVPKTFSGTIVSIYDIQGQQPSSPYEGQVVSTTGIVTANFGDSYFIQDGSGGWNGLFIYESGRNPSVGDSIVLTGEITEYYDKTEMKNITDYYFISANHPLPEPVDVATGAVDEQYESVLIRVKNAMCTDANYQGNYYMWAVNDGSGELKIHNTAVFEYVPVEGDYYDVTGPVNWDFGEWKIELRFESDVTTGTDNEGPEVTEVTPVLATNLQVMFNEEVEQNSAEDVANYSITNGITVESVLQHAFNKAQVNLTVSPLNGDYELTVSNVKDLSGNTMTPQTISFSYVGIEELFLDGEVNVFPNPASGKLNLTFRALDETTLDIYLTDLSGRVLRRSQVEVQTGENNIVFGLENLNRGVYLLNLSSEKGKLTYKVMLK